MSHKKKRSIIIGTLCGVLLLMVVGYAAFSSVLNIKGTSNISSNWNIKITSITSKTLSGSATNAKDPEGVGTLEASFETNLVSPGDSMEYTITISNQGNINAKLDKITLSDPDNEYVTFETSGLTEGDALNAGSTADLKVTVTFKDVDINKMEESTSNLTVTLDYSQADSSSETPEPSLPTINVKGVEIPVQEEESGLDGLYLDTYEPGIATLAAEDTNINARYVYKGKKPDNYILFNNKLGRILSIESDGTLKIIIEQFIDKIAFDTTGGTKGSKNWARPADLNTYLNNDFYNTLSNKAKSQIQTYNWKIGEVTWENTDLTNQIASENSVTWSGNIGLISASDVIRSNTNTTQCGNFSLNNTNKDICKTTSYLFYSPKTYWTINPQANWNNNPGGETYNVLMVGYDGIVSGGFPTSLGSALPALYLKSDITLSGSGTSSDPYTIN